MIYLLVNLSFLLLVLLLLELLLLLLFSEVFELKIDTNNK